MTPEQKKQLALLREKIKAGIPREQAIAEVRAEAKASAPTRAPAAKKAPEPKDENEERSRARLQAKATTPPRQEELTTSPALARLAQGATFGLAPLVARAAGDLGAWVGERDVYEKFRSNADAGRQAQAGFEQSAASGLSDAADDPLALLAMSAPELAGNVLGFAGGAQALKAIPGVGPAVIKGGRATIDAARAAASGLATKSAILAPAAGLLGHVAAASTGGALAGAPAGALMGAADPTVQGRYGEAPGAALRGGIEGAQAGALLGAGFGAAGPAFRASAGMLGRGIQGFAAPDRLMRLGRGVESLEAPRLKTQGTGEPMSPQAPVARPSFTPAEVATPDIVPTRTMRPPLQSPLELMAELQGTPQRTFTPAETGLPDVMPIEQALAGASWRGRPTAPVGPPQQPPGSIAAGATIPGVAADRGALVRQQGGYASSMGQSYVDEVVREAIAQGARDTAQAGRFSGVPVTRARPATGGILPEAPPRGPRDPTRMQPTQWASPESQEFNALLPLKIQEASMRAWAREQGRSPVPVPEPPPAQGFPSNPAGARMPEVPPLPRQPSPPPVRELDLRGKALAQARSTPDFVHAREADALRARLLELEKSQPGFMAQEKARILGNPAVRGRESMVEYIYGTR